MQRTPVFLPEESQGRGSLVGCHLWGRTESDTTEMIQQQQHRLVYTLMYLHGEEPYVFEHVVIEVNKQGTFKWKYPLSNWIYSMRNQEEKSGLQLGTQKKEFPERMSSQLGEMLQERANKTGRKCKMLQPLWKIVQRFLKKKKTRQEQNYHMIQQPHFWVSIQKN